MRGACKRLYFSKRCTRWEKDFLCNMAEKPDDYLFTERQIETVKDIGKKVKDRIAKHARVN